MVQRTVPRSKPLRRVPDRAVEIVARALDRLAYVETQGTVRGDRRGQGAAGAVGVLRAHARPADFEDEVAADGDVHGIFSVEVAPLDDYDARAAAEDPFAGPAHVVDR